jgi:hypothetical protein
MNPDMGDDWEAIYYTYDNTTIYVAGREPGTAGKTYTMLFYPSQFESLMNAQAIVYITCDLVDIDTFGNDAGTLSINQVDVDGFARPATNSALARAEPTLTFTSGFTGWTPNVSVFATPGNSAGMTPVVGSTIAITIAATNTNTEASVVNPGGASLESGRYYRTIFTVTSSYTGTNFGPTLRVGYTSSRFVWAVNQRLKGGGTFSAIGTTPVAYEVWAEAPTPFTGILTEPMQVKFSTYVDVNPAVPFNRPIAGTLRLTSAVTQSFAPSSFAPSP